MPAQLNDNYQRRVKYNGVTLAKQNHIAFAGSRVTATDTGTESEIDIASGGTPLTTQRAYAAYFKSQAMDTGNAEVALDLGTLQNSANNPLDVSVVASGQIKPLVSGLYSINLDISYQSAALSDDKVFSIYLSPPLYGIPMETGMTLWRSHATASLTWWHGGISMTTYLLDTDEVYVRRRLGYTAAGGSISVYTQVIRLL